jgi:hypothetical protein
MEEKKTKRHKRIRKVLLCIAVFLAVAIFLLSVVLYGPVTTLTSLKKVDDFPLYVMHYRGTYLFDLFAEIGMDNDVFQKIYKEVNPDACTSFAAMNPESDAVFGRNMDWRHKSSLLLFTDPPGGYASVSMVDLYYLGLEGMQEIPWSKRPILLFSPYATVDGMNEYGVVISQNAVPKRKVPKDPNKPTLLQSQILRLVLDHAKDVNEAIDLIKNYNVQFVMPNHFHIADASGDSAIIEYVDGKMVVVRDENPWQVSTNFLLCEEVKPNCKRYNTAWKLLKEKQGNISQDEAMDLLENTKLDFTVWSIVYNLSTGQTRLAMGRNYDQVHSFSLQMKHQH